ncbi:MAG: hypothetical protein P9M15_07670, partial [Candidatus Electryoneaceae bacterium]|nr:hypothetical protein [Candidatus Electryoneaceae bacterium]
RSRLEGSTPRFTAPQIRNALTIADSLFDASDRFNRELYIISNFYGSIWDSVAVMETESAQMVRRFILPIGPENLPNLSIGRVELKSSILQQGRPVELDVVLRNHSSQAVQTALVSVYLDDQRVAQASVNIAGEATVSRTFSIVPERTGQLAGWIKFEDIDPLAADSRRYFILDVPDSLRVMVVAPDSSARMVIQAAFAGDEAQFVRLNWGDPDGWETTSLAGYDVLLLAGVPTVSSGATRRVAEFVQRGGGVVLFQGTETDLADLSRGLWHRLGFAGARGTTVQGGIGWERIDLEHPLFTGMFEGEGSPKSPSLRFSVDLAIGDGDHVIIPLSDGRPLLIERQVGSGRALLYAVPLESRSGDFIYAGIFAPLLFRSVGYVSSCGQNGQSEWETGHRYRPTLSLPRAVTAQLTLPNDDRRELPPRPIVGGVEYNVGLIELPGIYDLSVDNRIIARYGVNVPNDLSNLVRNDISGTASRFGDAVIIDGDEEELPEIIYSVRYGRELWRPTAVIFLLLLVAESLLGRSSGREPNESVQDRKVG